MAEWKITTANLTATGALYVEAEFGPDWELLNDFIFVGIPSSEDVPSLVLTSVESFAVVHTGEVGDLRDPSIQLGAVDSTGLLAAARLLVGMSGTAQPPAPSTTPPSTPPTTETT